MVDTVATSMAAARCSYVGAVDPTDRLFDFWVPPELTSLVAGTADTVLREMLRDVSTQRALRRDLYRRGLVVAADVERERWWHGIRLVGLGKALTEGATVGVPVGEVTLDESYYRPLVAHLDNGTLTLADVCAIHPDLSLADALGSLALLAAGGYAAPEVPEWETSGARASARRLNEVLIAENRRGRDHSGLVAPATGASIRSEYVEMLVVGARWDGHPADVPSLVGHVLEVLAGQRRVLREGDENIDDPARARVIGGSPCRACARTVVGAVRPPRDLLTARRQGASMRTRPSAPAAPFPKPFAPPPPPPPGAKPGMPLFASPLSVALFPPAPPM